VTEFVSQSEAPVVAIIGGGFSGLLTAIHLLERDPAVVVRLVEKAERFGLGRAYAAANDEHLLNVRASNMSAFPDRPDHFTAWLAVNGGAGDGFVSRGRYGEYLQGLLRHAVRKDAGRLLLEQDEAVDLVFADGRLSVKLAMGRSFEAHAAVLAVGLAAPPSPIDEGAKLVPPRYFANPWTLDPEQVPSGDILLIGSGLTMVDVALSLARDDRRFTVVSRRGLLPQSHGAASITPIPDGSLETPRQALTTLRRHARIVGWRSAVDSIRPLTPAIWRRWSLAERRQFLRHGRAWWDVHRHRMAPQVADRLADLALGDRFEVLAARIQRLEPQDEGLRASLIHRGQAAKDRRDFAAAINCTGLSGDLFRLPLFAALARQRRVRPDRLALGIDVDDDLRVVDADGAAMPGLYAVGPLTRAARWETVAAPDLRSQTEELAATVLSDLARTCSAREGPARLIQARRTPPP